MEELKYCFNPSLQSLPLHIIIIFKNKTMLNIYLTIAALYILSKIGEYVADRTALHFVRRSCILHNLR